MKALGLVHVHSTISFDGKLSLQEIHDLAFRNGFQFVLLTEHIENLTYSDIDRLITQCREISDANCLLIPGLEIEDLCLYFLGMTTPVDATDYQKAKDQLIKFGAFVVLAHPHRLKRVLSSLELNEINAIEVWNVKDDGWRVPGYVGWKMWRNAQGRFPPGPEPIAGLDLHGADDFRRLGLEVEIPDLSCSLIMDRLREGKFVVWRAGKIFDPLSVTTVQRMLGFLIWMMRRAYRRLRGNHQLVPQVMRKQLKRLIKG